MAMQSVKEFSPDIDQGWAFVVMFCASLTMILTRGLTYTSAIFYITFLDEFQESPVFTAWAVSLNVFCSLIFCIVAANTFLLIIGSRITVIIGCVLSTVGLLVCSFATNLTMILVMYGIVTGCGNACIYVATYTMISIYFKKYRVVAYGVMSVGTGVGQLLYPPFLGLIIDEYVWRGAFIILAGINLNLLVVAACYMKPRQVSDSDEQEGESKKDKVVNVLRKLLKNISVFKVVRFPVFCLSIGIYNLGINGYTTHISNFGRVIDLSTFQVTFLPSMVGIGSIAGSLVIGIITQAPKVPVVGMYMLTFFMLGAFSIAITFIDNVIGVFVCCFGAGFSLATIALTYEVVIFIIGLERFSSAYSFALIFSASGSLAGGPLAALVYDMDPSYLWSFRTLGLIVIFGALLALPLWIECKLKQRKAVGALETPTAVNSATSSSFARNAPEANDSAISSREMDTIKGSSIKPESGTFAINDDIEVTVVRDGIVTSDQTRL